MRAILMARRAAPRACAAVFRQMMMTPRLQQLSLIALVALIALGLAMELWLSPIRPGGSWLALKVLPLVLCLRGTWLARRYTFQALSLLVWLYFAEGIVRATSDHGASAWLGGIEATLALVLFCTCAAFARLSAPSRQGQGGA